MTSIKKLLAPVAITAALALGSMSASAQTLFFSETIGPSLQTISPSVSSPAVGLPPGTEFTVIKVIENNSNASWHDFHVHLETLLDDVWVSSTEEDGISFDQAYKTAAEWAAATQVFVNSVQQTGYTAVRDIEFPSDTADFFFNDFKVNPGDVLQLTFNMSENDSNTWRLRQVASIPEPGTIGLLGLAVAGLAGLRRRKQKA